MRQKRYENVHVLSALLHGWASNRRSAAPKRSPSRCPGTARIGETLGILALLARFGSVYAVKAYPLIADSQRIAVNNDGRARHIGREHWPGRCRENG